MIIIKTTITINYIYIFIYNTKHRKTHLRRIIFFMIFNNLRVKSPITTMIENNIIESMAYRFV